MANLKRMILNQPYIFVPQEDRRSKGNYTQSEQREGNNKEQKLMKPKMNRE